MPARDASLRNASLSSSHHQGKLNNSKWVIVEIFPVDDYYNQDSSWASSLVTSLCIRSIAKFFEYQFWRQYCVGVSQPHDATFLMSETVEYV